MNKPGLVICLFLLLLVGCSQPEQHAEHHAGGDPGADSSVISITDFAGRTISFSGVPQRIAALSNGDADIVYALGGELVGRPTSNSEILPEEAKNVEQIGSTHEIDLEKLAYLQTEVVLGNHPLNMKDVEAVESIGAKMILTSANSVDDIKKQIGLIGELLQKQEKAAELIAAIDDKLKQLQPNGNKPKVLLVYGAPGTYMAALPNSLSGNILELAGGENIAASYPSLQDFPQYAQLNSERIVESNPQYIFLMTHGASDAVKEGFLREMESDPSWNGIDAVINNKVEVLPSDLFGTNPGTRVTEAIDLMRSLIQNAEQ